MTHVLQGNALYCITATKIVKNSLGLNFEMLKCLKTSYFMALKMAMLTLKQRVQLKQ